MYAVLHILYFALFLSTSVFEIVMKSGNWDEPDPLEPNHCDLLVPKMY